MLALQFAMLLWCNSYSFWDLLCCCGEAPTHLLHSQCWCGLTPARCFIRSVAVVKLLLALHLAMLLWCACCSFCNYQCCCGEAPARFEICNDAVVKLLFILKSAMLLWWSCCSLSELLCCCGEAPVRFGIHNVDVVKLLLALSFAMLLWWSSCSFGIYKIRIAHLHSESRQMGFQATSGPS